MPRGQSTTIYAEPAERILEAIIKRNATEEDTARARTRHIGASWHIDRRNYRVINVYRDNLKRLLLVGTLENK